MSQQSAVVKCTQFVLTQLYHWFVITLLLLSTLSDVTKIMPEVMSLSDRNLKVGESMTVEEAEPIYVVAEEDGKAVLPCNVTRPANDTIDLILWFRGDAETALYSLDARKAPIQRAKHFPSDDLSSRAYVDITGRPTALVVESVKASDAGEYKCRIDFRKGRTQYRTVQLDVIVSAKEVIIMDEYGQRLRDPVGPYNEGAHLSIICEAEGGKPRPLLIWWKDMTLLDDTSTVTPQGIVRNELVITRLHRSDHKSVLSCRASNSNLTKPVTASITLELNLRPLDAKITTLKRPVTAGHKIEVSCQSSGSRPPALVTWWKGSKRIPHHAEEISSNENVTVSTVHFTPSIEDNGKTLACRADHAILPDSALEDTWTLDVYYTPKLSVSLGASIHHDQVREGSNVSLECHVQSNPPVSDVGWKYEGKPIMVNHGTDKTSNGLGFTPGLGNQLTASIVGNTLFLTRVTRQYSGKYKCVAANAEGEGESDDIHMKVLYAPICKPDQRLLYGVAKREPIKVPCEVDADPTQVTFRWAFNNSLDVVPVKTFISTKTRSVVQYSPRTKFGYGEMYCWARNKIGEQQEPCVFQVIPAGPPQPVKNCLVGNQSTDSLVIKCESGDDGGLEQQFFLEIYESERGQLQSNWTSVKGPVFEVSSLPIGTSFVLVLYAANAKGRSNYVTLTANTLPFPNSGPDGIKTVILYLLISSVGFLVIIAIAIMIISKVRGFDGDNNKDLRRNNSRGSSVNRRNSDDANAENTRRCTNQNGGIPLTPLYVKGYDICDANVNVNDLNESWDRQINPEKLNFHHMNEDPDDGINGTGGIMGESRHVTLEQRRTPEGDAYIERSASDSTSTMSSTHVIPSDYKRINRYLMPPPSILRDNTVLMVEDDNTITSETPLMNGIYYTSFTSNTHRTAQQKHVTPLSTPV